MRDHDHEGSNDVITGSCQERKGWLQLEGIQVQETDRCTKDSDSEEEVREEGITGADRIRRNETKMCHWGHG